MDDPLKKKDNERRLKLDVVHAFGSNCSNGYRDSVAIMEDDNRRIVFPVGKYIALKQLDRPDMGFIRLSDSLDQMVCMAVSGNKK